MRMRPLLALALIFAACAPLPGEGEGEGEGGSWTEMPELPLGPRQETGVAVLDGEMYVVGGFDEARQTCTNPRSVFW